MRNRMCHLRWVDFIWWRRDAPRSIEPAVAAALFAVYRPDPLPKVPPPKKRHHVADGFSRRAFAQRTALLNELAISVNFPPPDTFKILNEGTILAVVEDLDRSTCRVLEACDHRGTCAPLEGVRRCRVIGSLFDHYPFHRTPFGPAPGARQDRGRPNTQAAVTLRCRASTP